MKKVAIVSAINTNYGTLLQAYAMQTELKKIGIDTEILYYTSNPIKQFYRIFNLKFLITKLKAVNVKMTAKCKYPDIYKKLRLRDNVFMSFRKNNLVMTSHISDKKELSMMIKNYRGVVLGSDQVWNPQNLEMDYYTLNFVPDDIPKVAYAPSFGVSEIPKQQIKRTQSYLNRIQHISVRETAGKQIIQKITGRNVPVVCDPTALLTSEQWDQLKSKKQYTEGKYIFCYFLGSNMQYRDFANRMAENSGLPIIAIQHMDEFVKGDLNFADIVPYDVDPSDFINLVANAELVLTDSFHGMMFSVYYRRNFFVFNYDSGKRASVNSRIDSIMNYLDIDDRRLYGTEDVTDCLERTIDWDKIHSQLDGFRHASEEYLLNALSASGILTMQK